MPTLNQIEEILDRHELSWAQACTQAGLAAPARPAGRASLTLEEAIHAFIADVGKMPRYGRDLRRWAAARKVSFHFARYPAAEVRAAIDTITTERARVGQLALDLATLAGHPACARDQHASAQASR